MAVTSSGISPVAMERIVRVKRAVRSACIAGMANFDTWAVGKYRRISNHVSSPAGHRPKEPNMRVNALTRKAAIALAGFAIFAAAAATAEPVKIRVGWVNVPGQIT